MKKVNYIITEYFDEQRQVHVQDLSGKDLCKTLKAYDMEHAQHMVNAYSEADSEDIEVRKQYAARRIDGIFAELLSKEKEQFIKGTICAGELERARHETMKELLYAFGQIPDTQKRDRLVALDGSTPAERKVYILEVIGGEEKLQGLHPEFQKKPLEKWIAGELSGEEYWRNLLQMEFYMKQMAQNAPG